LRESQQGGLVEGILFAPRRNGRFVARNGNRFMDEGTSFLELIKKVRAADPSAAVELVRRYEPAIRRIVRLQMRDPRLRRILDSMDVCQSVLASFFFRAATGQYDLNQPAQLLRLLAVMARNKVASQARKSYVMRRERVSFGEEDASTAALAPGPGPDHQADWKDMLQEVRNRLSDDERRLADRRAERREWTEIATELGGSPEALRKQLARALDRVSHQLGLDEWRHG
jgi:RNA polymerase sigma-70 factor (ECF subfamily)